MKKTLLIASVISGILCLLALGRFVIISIMKANQSKGLTYEEREAENEKQIQERLLASCSVVGSVIYHLDYSADGKYVVLSASDVEIRSGKDLSLINSWSEGGVGPVAFHPNGQILAQDPAGIDGQVEIRTVPEGKVIKTIYTDTDKQDWDGPKNYTGYDASVVQLKFSPDGQYLLTRTDNEWKVKVWNTSDPPNGEAGWSLKCSLRDNETYILDYGPPTPEKEKAGGLLSGTAQMADEVYWADFAPDSQSVYISIAPRYHFSTERVMQLLPQEGILEEPGKIIQYGLDGQKIRELKDEMLLENLNFCFSKNGKYLLFNGVNKKSDRLSKALWVLDKTPKLVWLPDVTIGGNGFDFFYPYHAVGTYDDAFFSIWDIEKLQNIYSVDLPGKIGDLKFSSDGKRVAVASGGSCFLFRATAD